MNRVVLVTAPLVLVLFVGCPRTAPDPFDKDEGADGGDGGDAGDTAALDATGSDATTESRGTGALCGVNGTDQCGPFMTCDATLGCAECAGNADCPAAARACLQGQCAGCRPGAEGAADCPEGQACSSADFECHPSCAVGGCTQGMLCEAETGACVGCRGPADCLSGACSNVTRLCVACESDTSCERRTPRCRRLTGTCVACLSNDDCGRTAPICDPATFTCRVGCISDAQCPGQRCDLATARCVNRAPVTPDGGAAVDGGE